MKRILYAALLFLVILPGCYSSKDAFVQNFAFLYRKNANPFRPDLSIYHFNPDSSRVFVKFSTSELEPVRENNADIVSYFISYQLYNSIDESKLLDSLTFPVMRMRKGSMAFTDFRLKVAAGSYLLQLKIADANRKTVHTFYLNIDKTGNQSRQYFLATQHNQPVLGDVVTSNSPVSLQYSEPGDVQFFVKYYKRKFSIADPPFALDRPTNFDYQADSTFIISDITKDSLTLKKEGFYHIQAGPNAKNGLTLFRFYDEFPNIVSPVQMIESIRYLTTKKEYDDLINTPNQRQAVDKFWLDIGNDPERTRELIRKYYSRVVEANRLFSSYKEGWKTDRGMIYIIYGAPNIVYRTSNSESWVYGDETSFLSTNFTFIKVNNPFTDNDFTLNRAPLYQTNWYTTIDIWRHGRAYNEN